MPAYSVLARLISSSKSLRILGADKADIVSVVSARRSTIAEEGSAVRIEAFVPQRREPKVRLAHPCQQFGLGHGRRICISALLWLFHKQIRNPFKLTHILG